VSRTRDTPRRISTPRGISSPPRSTLPFFYAPKRTPFEDSTPVTSPSFRGSLRRACVAGAFQLLLLLLRNALFARARRESDGFFLSFPSPPRFFSFSGKRRHANAKSRASARVFVKREVALCHHRVTNLSNHSSRPRVAIARKEISHFYAISFYALRQTFRHSCDLFDVPSAGQWPAALLVRFIFY